jgi:hypothetical protein
MAGIWSWCSWRGSLRRELPVRFKLALQQVGVVLLVALMVLVLLNDLRR